MHTFHSKCVLVSLVLWSFAAPAFALDQKQLDNRVQLLTSKLETLQDRADKAIPAETLKKALGVILLDRTKGGLVFGYQGGNGLAMVRDAKKKTWSPAGFLVANEGSFGLQIGGEQDFYVILLMNAQSLKLLTDPNFQFGGEAQASAGDSSGRTAGDVTAPEQSMLIYDLHKGFYSGAVVKGGGLSPQPEANNLYYGQAVSMKDILFDHKVKISDTATALAKKLDEYSQPPKK